MVELVVAGRRRKSVECGVRVQEDGIDLAAAAYA
jgi:hypothetical protein